MIEVQVRFYNSLTKYATGGARLSKQLADGATVADALDAIEVPEPEIFLLLHNGRNIMRGFGCNSGIETDQVLTDGDVLALSGPVPFSRGYGSPVI
jgi:hypothetical protein